MKYLNMERLSTKMNDDRYYVSVLYTFSSGRLMVHMPGALSSVLRFKVKESLILEDAEAAQREKARRSTQLPDRGTCFFTSHLLDQADSSFRGCLFVRPAQPQQAGCLFSMPLV